MRIRLFGRRIGRLGKLLEADCRLDVVAHDGLAGFKIAAEHCIDPFAQKGLSKYPVALDVAFDQIPEAFCLCHLRLRSAPSALALFVVPPISVRFVDIALLLLLRAARQQDHQGLAILSEIDPVARPEIDAILEHAFANRLHIGKIALLQADYGARDLSSRNGFQIRKPLGERLPTVDG